MTKRRSGTVPRISTLDSKSRRKVAAALETVTTPRRVRSVVELQFLLQGYDWALRKDPSELWPNGFIVEFAGWLWDKRGISGSMGPALSLLNEWRG